MSLTDQPHQSEIGFPGVYTVRVVVNHLIIPLIVDPISPASFLRVDHPRRPHNDR